MWEVIGKEDFFMIGKNVIGMKSYKSKKKVTNLTFEKNIQSMHRNYFIGGE